MSVIKKYRKKMDITQVELADCLAISKSFMSQIESGKFSCPKYLTHLIADVLRCDVDTLFKQVAERKTRYVARKGR